jgi:translation elongation factor EF-Tu-like GTPase
MRSSPEPEAGARFLFTVEDAFQIEARGTVLFPGVLLAAGAFPPAKVILRRPDGSQFESVASLELIRLGKPSDTLPILLRGTHKSEVPRGTEVWLSDGIGQPAK